VLLVCGMCLVKMIDLIRRAWQPVIRIGNIERCASRLMKDGIPPTYSTHRFIRNTVTQGKPSRLSSSYHRVVQRRRPSPITQQRFPSFQSSSSPIPKPTKFQPSVAYCDVYESKSQFKSLRQQQKFTSTTSNGRDVSRHPALAFETTYNKLSL
jgi:hypothetical protein